MLSEESLGFLEKLLKSSGPSGFEFEAAAVCRDYAKTFADKVYTDVMGNTFAVLNPDAKFKVMLAGHYDEIGFQVVHVSDEGLIYFRSVGGIDKHTVPGLDVNILTANGPVPGVIGRKPIHLQTAKERETPSEISDLWIDIGAENGEEARKMVAVGDPVAFRVNYRRAGANRVISKGLDDKIGAFVVFEVLKKLAANRPDVGVYAVGTVQEEVGCRGAKAGSFGLDPQVGFCVDVSFATDVPGVKKELWGDISLGKGPILSRNADNNAVLHRRIVEIAAKDAIPYQIQCGHRATGGTDTAMMQITCAGMATALFSIPNRYMHTPVEVCDLRDAEGAIDLMAATIRTFKGNETFIPGID